MKHVLVSKEEFASMLEDPERSSVKGTLNTDCSSTWEEAPIALAGEHFKSVFNNEPDTIYYVPK